MLGRKRHQGDDGMSQAVLGLGGGLAQQGQHDVALDGGALARLRIGGVQ